MRHPSETQETTFPKQSKGTETYFWSNDLVLIMFRSLCSRLRNSFKVAARWMRRTMAALSEEILDDVFRNPPQRQVEVESEADKAAAEGALL